MILFAQGRGMGGIEEQRKEDPFAVNDKILNSKHTLDSKSLFGEEESGDESNMTSSKDDEDDSLNGGERSRVIKEKITETFVELPTKEENAASRNFDDRKVEDDWDEPIQTMVITFKEELTRHLWPNHPRENSPHQGIQTRA